MFNSQCLLPHRDRGHRGIRGACAAADKAFSSSWATRTGSHVWNTATLLSTPASPQGVSEPDPEPSQGRPPAPRDTAPSPTCRRACGGPAAPVWPWASPSRARPCWGQPAPCRRPAWRCSRPRENAEHLQTASKPAPLHGLPRKPRCQAARRGRGERETQGKSTEREKARPCPGRHVHRSTPRKAGSLKE